MGCCSLGGYRGWILADGDGIIEVIQGHRSEPVMYLRLT